MFRAVSRIALHDLRLTLADRAAVIEEVLSGHEALEVSDFQTVMEADRVSRIDAERIVRRLC